MRSILAIYKKNSLLSVERHVGNLHMETSHFHELYEFYYLKSGSVTYLAGDRIYHLSAGDTVVIPPNTLHKTVSARDAQRERILFYLDERYINTLFDIRKTLPTDIAVFKIHNGRIGEIFENMLAEFSGECSEVYLKALICELSVLLSRALDSDGRCSLDADRSPKIVTDALGYIEENYMHDVSLSGVAEHFFVSAEYLSRAFKKHTGFTFSEYLNHYRIKESNKLLIQTDMKISEIATACGFHSSNHFCKSYKKTVGTSALKYRKKTSLW